MCVCAQKNLQDGTGISGREGRTSIVVFEIRKISPTSFQEFFLSKFDENFPIQQLLSKFTRKNEICVQNSLKNRNLQAKFSEKSNLSKKNSLKTWNLSQNSLENQIYAQNSSENQNLVQKFPGKISFWTELLGNLDLCSKFPVESKFLCKIHCKIESERKTLRKIEICMQNSLENRIFGQNYP